jgi:putative peptide zinc metalloprotease protein
VVGVAFMVLVPMLYTDVTDAWRLGDRRARLAIDAAGILVEIALACLALFLWPFMPEGPAKTAAFMVATASLILTLGLNLNPFMRFDGYYLLADALRIDNLQTRAFSLGRWKVRDLLFAAGEPCPEHFSPIRRRLLITYAWATWVYRLIVFTGIALLVYHMFFKALGLILFAIEIAFFIVLPIVREIRAWWENRQKLCRTRRAAATAALLVILLAAFIVPWSSRVEIPAVIEIRGVARLYPARAARVISVHAVAGQAVEAGALLVTLEAPEIAAQMRLASTKLELVQVRLSRRTVDAQDREQSLVLEDEQRALRTQLAGLHREQKAMVMQSPFTGRLLELEPTLQAGRWIGKTELIASIGKLDTWPSSWIVRGYVGESDVWRIATGARGVFIPFETPLLRIGVVLDEIALAGASNIELPEVLSIHGGAIAVEEDRARRQIPVAAQYLATLTPETALPGAARVIRGVVVLHGTEESFAARVWRQVSSILIRETGF